jgi:glycosyltransferase involved in cell wall biosynthesis
VKIALNAWFIDQPTTGSGQYLLHLLSEYARDTEHQFLLCVRSGAPHGSIPGLGEGKALASRFERRAIRTPFDGHTQQLAKVWFEQVGFPAHSRRWGADLLHVPYWASPLVAATPVVVTIHDLIPILLPAYRGNAFVRLYTGLVAWTARRAAYVLTDSESARQDILHHLRLPAVRVQAVHLAADGRFRPVRDPQALQRVQDKYHLPSRFLLYLGGYDVRKNVPGVLQAFARLDVPDLHLVIAGRVPDQDTPFFPSPQRIAQELDIHERVCFTGWVDDHDKPALYSQADAFLFPSYYEGFGLPPLEAMSCGTPVIVSDRSSLPEIVGDAGICVDPDDPDALAQAIAHVIGDPLLRETLREAGLERARRFTWQQTAQATLLAYQRTIANWNNRTRT